MTRAELAKAMLKAHLDTPHHLGSWAAKPSVRVEHVLEPAWAEIERLQGVLRDIALAPKSRTKYALQQKAAIALGYI